MNHTPAAPGFGPPGVHPQAFGPSGRRAPLALDAHVSDGSSVESILAQVCTSVYYHSRRNEKSWQSPDFVKINLVSS